MNLIIQVIGLIFNIYLVFLLTSNSYVNSPKRSEALINKEIIINKFSWMEHTSQDFNRLKILNRVGILLIICYGLFELNYLMVGNS
jgi:hypothetical protein